MNDFLSAFVVSMSLVLPFAGIFVLLFCLIHRPLRISIIPGIICALLGQAASTFLFQKYSIDPYISAHFFSPTFISLGFLLGVGAYCCFFERFRQYGYYMLGFPTAYLVLWVLNQSLT